ncbi:MAG: acyl-CoA thioesterase [Actinomycetales bacterium]
MSDIAEGRMSFSLSYGDCDMVGIAYFDIYYRWMERTYTGWLYSHGLRSGQIREDLGVLIAGVSSGCDYHAPATVFDELTCQAGLARMSTSSYRIEFGFTRDDQPITTGQMTFACRTPEWAKAPVPDRLAELLGTLPVRQVSV